MKHQAYGGEMTGQSASEETDRSVDRRQIAIAAAIQVAITLAAYAVLKRTSDERLRGPRWLWRVLIPASVTQLRGSDMVLAPFGPVLFFVLGRRRARSVSSPPGRDQRS